MKNFKNKNIIITGAGSGIGRALSIDFASRGANLALSDIDEDSLNETITLVKSFNIKSFAKELDVADKAAMNKYPEEVLENLGEPDVIINNAGVTLTATFEEHTVEDFEWLFGIDFWGVLYGCKYFLPYLLKRPEAHIVNISSIFGLISVPGQSSYNAAKFAVRGLTESMRQELEETNVSISCIHPGGIKTNIARKAKFKSGPMGTSQSEFIDKFDEITYTTPQQAAKTIINGIINKEEKVLIGPDAYFIDGIQRILPVQYSKVVKALQSFIG